MKIAIITGDHPRHKYFVDYVSKLDLEVIWIIQERENFLPSSPFKNIDKKYSKLFKIHFDQRFETEHKFFKDSGNVASKNINKVIKIKSEDLKNDKLLNLIKNETIDILISYGCYKLDDKILYLVKKFCWNVHGGLSPWYRGAATHFWPTYMLEPQFTGMTLHETTQNIDWGDIIHQTSINLSKKDGVHDNACRAVVEFSHDIYDKLKLNIDQLDKIKPIQNITSGRIWTTSMWHPGHLELIYNVYENKVNKFCLENNFCIRVPKLKSVFN